MASNCSLVLRSSQVVLANNHFINLNAHSSTLKAIVFKLSNEDAQ